MGCFVPGEILHVKALNGEYGQLVSQRLKQGTYVSLDKLDMFTSVYVEDPTVFCKCLEWKAKQIENSWKEYFRMKPAVG